MNPKHAPALAHMTYVGLALTVGMTVAGHLDADPRLSAVGHTISDFAANDLTGPVSIAVFICAASSVALVAGLRAVRAPLTRAATALLLTWPAGLLVAGIVPTDPVGVDLTTGGYVHRYASFAAFASLLVAGLLLSRSVRADRRWRDLGAPVLGLTAAAGGGGLAMLISTYLADRVLIGLAERIMAGLVIALLFLLALRLLRLVNRPQPRTRLVLSAA